jgi:hypothetical protein
MKHLKLYSYLFMVSLLACNEESVLEKDISVIEIVSKPCAQGFRIQNYWKPEMSIAADEISAFASATSAAKWEFITATAGTYFIRNATDQRYLSTLGSGDPFMDIEKYGESSQWLLELVNGGGAGSPGDKSVLLRIKNVAQKTYLNIEKGTLKGTSIQSGWYSAMWYIYKDVSPVFFWVQNSFNCGDITVKVGGQQGIIKSTISTGTVSCTSTNGALFSLPPCTYDFTASCTGKSWKGKITVPATGCTTYQLK